MLTGQGIKPVHVYECQIARRALMQIPEPDEDRLWSIPRTDHYILGRWQHGNCSIKVAGRTRTAEDWFSLKEVAELARDIIRECVGRRVHSGGRMKVGPKKVFNVVVMHKDGIPDTGSSV